MKSGIYKIKNLVNEKFYIGSSNNVKRRWMEHNKLLRGNKHPNIYLQSAWNKYWEFNFEFSILEYCNLENLIEREQFFLDLLKPHDREIGYNLNPTANSNAGYKFSNEFREMRRRIQTGKRPSAETRAKMSTSHTNRKRDPEIGKLISKAKKGKKINRVFTDEEKLIQSIKVKKTKRRQSFEKIPVGEIINVS